MKKLFSTLFACVILLSCSQAMTVTSPKADTVVYLSGDRNVSISFFADRSIDYLYFGKPGFDPATALMSYSMFGANPADITLDQLAHDISYYIDSTFTVGSSITLEWTAGYVKQDNSTAYATNKLKIKFIRNYFYDEPHPYSLFFPANKSAFNIAGPDNSKSIVFKWNKAVTDSILQGGKSKIEYTLYIDSVTSDFVSDPVYYLYTSNKVTDTSLVVNYTELYNSIILGMGVQKSKSITVKWHVLGFCQDCTPQDPTAKEDFELTLNYVYGVGIDAISTSNIGVYNSNEKIYLANPNNEQMKSLELMDLQGRVVFKRPLNFEGANMIFDLPSELANELYVWKVNYQNGQVSGKILLTK